MEKRYYTAATLEAELLAFEGRFGLSTEHFYAAKMQDQPVDGIDPFDSFVWAQTYRAACRMRSATAELQPAG